MPRKKMTEEEKKSKLTINVNENLLKKIDELSKLRSKNRSQLIEDLLIEYINKQ
jgi:metal-responsive CopG/Arc/MetJ family transcriptional regulator